MTETHEQTSGLRLAISRALAESGSGNEWPLNGLREEPWADMSGWFLWTGEAFPRGADEWESLHVSHAERYVPHAVPHLSLAPGWRFLVTPDQEDVWFDESLLTPK